MRRHQVQSTLFTLCALYLTLTVGCADQVGLYDDDHVTEKVIGGEVVRNAPDEVAVLLMEVYDAAGEYSGLHAFCTGVLVDNKHLLTAAHCLNEQEFAVSQGHLFACFGESE